MRINARRYRLQVVLLTTLSTILVGCPPVPTGTDLSISNIEITQAIQTTTNTIPLVAQRSTAVRVTVATTISDPVPGVTGRLHVFVDGSEVTPPAGLVAINVLTAPPSPQRGNEEDTLNFELPAPSGITASSNVDFQVEVSAVGEVNIGNNSGSVDDLTFVDRTTPSIFFTRINYTPAGFGLPAIGDVEAGVGDMFARAIFPVNDGDPNFYRQGLFPTLAYTEDADGDGNLQALGSDGNNLLSLLASCRQLIVAAGLGANDNTFLYGWIAGNPINGNGLGQISGFNAFGNTQLTRHQRTLAHELGHNFGLSHNSRTLSPEVGWDTLARLPGNPAGNNTTGRLKGTALNDIMVGGQLTNSAWVDTTTYNFFLGSLILASRADDLGASQSNLSTRVLVVQGIFDPEGQELIELEPAFRFPWPSQPTSREQEGQFAVEVIDENQNVINIQFNALVGDDAGKEQGEGELPGFFEVMVPVSPDSEVVALRITDAEGTSTFGAFERSEPPSIQIVAPQGGAELGEQTEIAWELSDSDTPVDDLLLQVAYSPDDGESFVPVAVDVPGSQESVVFDSTQIQRSQGTGLIRVFVSDGLNTAFDEVRGLTAAAAVYE